MSLSSGTQLGPYEVVSPLGAGGMGEVYRARDSRIGREVAIKVLPVAAGTDVDRLRRFEQEARVVGALNHPNILALFDIGTHDAAPFIVTELLEGETLRDKLQAGALSPRRAIEIAVQIADGLAAAHDKGIIHRDLKPENIIITRDGRVKILDFGLAKLAYAEAQRAVSADGATSAGMTHTTPGLILGTAAYMSPEQVRGQELDGRTDIFSLGAILYEMLSGRRAFHAASSIETLNSILKEDPPEIDSSAVHVSPGLERLMRRCLEKDPNQRFQSARDLKFAMEALSGTSSIAQLPVLPHRSRWLWPVVAALVLVLGVLALVLARTREPASRSMHLAIVVRGEVSELAISPDGNTLAFVSPDETSGKPLLFVQPIGSDKANPLPGTEGAQYPFWSPSNDFIGYFANGRLLKISASGGPPQALATVTQAPRGGAWSAKGVIVYAMDAGGPLWRVNVDGTGAAPLTDKLFTGNEVSHRWPVFLPDGDHLLFFGGDFTVEGNYIYLTTLAAKEKKLITKSDSNPGFAAPNHLFYADRAGQLFVRDFDFQHQAPSGEPRIVLDQVGYQPSVSWAAFTVAATGTVVASPISGASRSVLTVYDRTGKQLGTVGQSGILYNPALSPDGQRVAVDAADLQASNVNVWIHSLAGETATRFTFGESEDVSAVWSRDGSRIAYRSVNLGALVKAASGLEKERVVAPLPRPGDDVLPNSWSADDRRLVCTVQSARGGSQLYLVDIADSKMIPVISGKGNHSLGQVSPDGRWLAYASDESGSWEIYVTTFPAAQGKWQVSQGGGTEPRWRGDGKEIFYISANGTMTAVPVNATVTFSSGTPQELFPAHSRTPISSTDLYSYDVSKDGQRFIVNTYLKPAYVAPLDIIFNAAR